MKRLATCAIVVLAVGISFVFGAAPSYAKATKPIATPKQTALILGQGNYIPECHPFPVTPTQLRDCLQAIVDLIKSHLPNQPHNAATVKKPVKPVPVAHAASLPVVPAPKHIKLKNAAQVSPASGSPVSGGDVAAISGIALALAGGLAYRRRHAAAA